MWLKSSSLYLIHNISFLDNNFVLVQEEKSCDAMSGFGWKAQESLAMCVSWCKDGGAGLAVYGEGHGNCKCCDGSKINKLFASGGSNVYEI